MKGYRTLAFALGIAVVGVLQAFDWTSIIPQDKPWTGMATMAIAVGIAALRGITTTSVGKA